ncbi:polyphosphate polymerase domain-containing protein [Muriicola sp. Z0-33]|uniref:polyphosphate polymerase domain-containing protein n=1 Tax=Muriicola sp. Z0-33 TaxID=2816957 RepID=UPI0022379D19|nr:polyphosphate polymerase domain-containing protein [Muriicola sp. Z0-33]MCW5515378.1 polyphosphate polymerase domain-containing protein [Muriicola sp. Z0-33]
MNTAKAADKISGMVDTVKGNNLRYERKFIFVSDYLEDLISLLYLNSYCFSEIYERRQVNNVYFDDNNLNFYKQNVSGVGEREKYRLRWYGDDFSSITNPTVEIKKKFGEVGDKLSFKIKDFNYQLDAGDAWDLKEQVLARLGDEQQLINNLSLLNPTLFNAYERRYFLSACGKFRVTLDYHQRFYNPGINQYQESIKKIDKRIVVLELKYDMADDFEARRISQQFSSRVSRNSKYVQGVDLINGRTLF